MDIIYWDISKDLSISWTQLIRELNRIDTYNIYCYHPDSYDIIKHLILSLILGKQITLIDAGFSSGEIEKLIGHTDFDNQQINLEASERPCIKNKAELLRIFTKVNESWGITLFTSGTTGIPKSIKHSFRSIARFAKTSHKFSTNIWGLAYNPTSMAGIQVLFQAILNGNSIVRLHGLSQYLILKSIGDYNVTHISATPTFFRLLLPCKGVFPKVTHITSGGEKFDDNVKEKLITIFPNARFKNVYASTEAGTIFGSDGDVFSIKPEIESFVKIEYSELLIHRSIMGFSDTIHEEWYHTGDMVEIVSENPIRFKFVARINEMINVGGYKVNPHEVEEIISAIDGVKNVRVYGKKNSVLGTVICCDIVKGEGDIQESQIRSYLSSCLKEYKIPRIISFVDEISLSRSGKIKRNTE